MTDNKPARVGMRRKLLNNIISAIDEHQEMPWDNTAPSIIRPFNPASGVIYRGGNVTNLIVEQSQRGSDDPRWMTLKQANSAGYGIRAGAQGAVVEYWDFGKREAPPKEDGEAEAEEPIEAPPRPFYAVVFNGRDIVGLPPFNDRQDSPENLARRLILEFERGAMNANLFHMRVEGRTYDPVNNRLEGEIDMGLLKPYRVNLNANDLVAELHVLAQWSGHSSRLNRVNTEGMSTFQDYENSEARIKEDLRVSIAVMLMKNIIGLDGKMKHSPDRNIQIAEFLRSSKSGKDEIFRAARDAEKIVEYLFSFSPELKEKIDNRINIHRLAPQAANKGAGKLIDLPNFIPPGAAAKTGKDDPRWNRYVSEVGDWLMASGHSADVVNKTLTAVEPQFTQLMNAGLAKGKTVDDMHEMFKNQFSEKLQASRVQIELWDKFCADARSINLREHLFEDSVLASLINNFGDQFKEVIQQNADQMSGQNIPLEARLSTFLFGEMDSLTSERLKDIHAQLVSDDEVVLTPTKIHHEIADEMGIMDEDVITGYNPSHQDDDLDFMDLP